MSYSIYDLATGRVEKVVTCPVSDLYLHYDAETHGVFDGWVLDSSTYIEDGVAVTMPQRPDSNHTFNWATKQWDDQRTLQELKDAKWAEMKRARSEAEYAGFAWDGSVFDSDPTSQNRITGAVTLAMSSASFSIGWVLADNSVRTLSQTEMIQTGAALGVHVATQFAKGVTLRVQIEAAATKGEVEAITWETI